MIDYQCVTLQDLDEVEALYRKYLDNGSSLRERIDKIFSKNSTYSCKAVDTDTGKIVGIAVYECGLILSCGHHEICEKIYDEIGKDATIYTGESLLVETEYRDKKISYGLNEHIRTKMEVLAKERGASVYVLHEMWVYPNGKTPAFKVVNGIYGIFRDFGIIPEFYRDYYKHGHLCPICGENCKCSARITISKID